MLINHICKLVVKNLMLEKLKPREGVRFGNITLNEAPLTPSLHSQYSWQQVNTATYYTVVGEQP